MFLCGLFIFILQHVPLHSRCLDSYLGPSRPPGGSLEGRPTRDGLRSVPASGGPNRLDREAPPLFLSGALPLMMALPPTLSLWVQEPLPPEIFRSWRKNSPVVTSPRVSCPGAGTPPAFVNSPATAPPSNYLDLRVPSASC